MLNIIVDIKIKLIKYNYNVSLYTYLSYLKLFCDIMRLKPEIEKELYGYFKENFPQIKDIKYEINPNERSITVFSKEKLSKANLTEEQIKEVGEILHTKYHNVLLLKNRSEIQCIFEDDETILND